MNAPIAIDLFAGYGGFSLGAEQAGARVAYAANHWPLAVCPPVAKGIVEQLSAIL